MRQNQGKVECESTDGFKTYSGILDLGYQPVKRPFRKHLVFTEYAYRCLANIEWEESTFPHLLNAKFKLY